MKDQAVQLARDREPSARLNVLREYLQHFVLRTMALERRLDSLDWPALLADVRPFLERPDDVALLEHDLAGRVLAGR